MLSEFSRGHKKNKNPEILDKISSLLLYPVSSFLATLGLENNRLTGSIPPGFSALKVLGTFFEVVCYCLTVHYGLFSNTLAVSLDVGQKVLLWSIIYSQGQSLLR
jgi:hypothetical protein